MYVTHEDLIALCSHAELVQLSHDEMGYHADYAGTEPDWAVIDVAIRHACEVADGYLAGRYHLPLTQVPTMLTHWCADMARFYLHRRRINASEMPKPLQLAYDDAHKLLAAVRDGKMHLGIQDTTPLQPEKGAYQVRARGKSDWSAYDA